MGSTAYTDDVLTITPPLNGREQAYLRRLNRSAAGRMPRPGSYCPWAVSEDGTTLSLLETYGTKAPIAEWVAYLADHLLGPAGPQRHGRALAGFTYDHQLTGDVAVEGPARGDRWTLECRPDGISVRRAHLPCASCWAELLLMARPSVAYRFVHPVRAANLADGRFPDFDHDAMEAECRSQTWTPVGPTVRAVRWPWSPDLWGAWWIDLAHIPDARPFRWGDELDDDEPCAQVFPFPRPPDPSPLIA